MINYIQILLLYYPNTNWSMDGDLYSGLVWQDESPKPSQQELDALWLPTQETLAKKVCKSKATELLFETDWTSIPDVADPANSPYLANQADFIAYRNQVRQLAVNPVVDPIFPVKPTEVWA